MWPPKEKALEFDRVSVEVKMNRAILGEKCIKIFAVKRMRMRAFGGQNQEIGNIHDTNAEVRSKFTEESCRCDHFEGDFYANPNEYATMNLVEY